MSPAERWTHSLSVHPPPVVPRELGHTSGVQAEAPGETRGWCDSCTTSKSLRLTPACSPLPGCPRGSALQTLLASRQPANRQRENQKACEDTDPQRQTWEALNAVCAPRASPPEIRLEKLQFSRVPHLPLLCSSTGDPQTPSLCPASFVSSGESELTSQLFLS